MSEAVHDHAPDTPRADRGGHGCVAGHAHGTQTHADDQIHGGDSRRLAFALCLTGGFMVAELVGGYLSGSLALIADAGHMASDTVALGIALVAMRAARMPADKKRSYGYRRAQVLAAFVNALALVAIAVWIFLEAVQRLFDPVEILPVPMLVIAVLGLFVNLLALQFLHGADHANLNVRGALWHVLGDLLGSIAAIAAAAIVYTTGWLAADPLLSLLVVGVIVAGAVPLLKETSHILLEGTPHDVEPDDIVRSLNETLEPVLDVHHVRIWSLDPDNAVITLHAVLDAAADPDATLASIRRHLAEVYGLLDATIQIERKGCERISES